MSELHSRPEADLVAGTFYGRNPFPAFAWMREHEPVYHDRKNDLYGITRHADIMRISQDSKVFVNGKGFRPDAPSMPMMINMDRPEHLVRRNLVSKGFTPRVIASMEPEIRRITTEILDAVCERGECDLVRDIAAQLPLIVIGNMLGVEREDRARLLEWSDAMLSAVGSPEPGATVRAAQTFAEYSEYNRRVVADRRARPRQDDLMSLLVHAEIDGHRLDADSLLFESLLILIGGDETTRHVISGGAHQLMLHPAQRRLLIDEPARLPVAIEEMLRWVTPIQNMMRTAAEDVSVGSHRFREGDRMLLLYPSGNRDAAVFERPDEFDITRTPNEHVAFGGYGAHICLGKSLARLELQVIFEELLRRMPDLEPASSEPPRMREANFVVGYESLPVRFTPSRPVAA